MEGIVIAAIITTSVALFLGIFNLILSIKQSSRVEQLKSQMLRNNFVHQLQFEKEFNLYSELWIQTIELADLTAIVSDKIDEVTFSELLPDVLKLLGLIKKNRDFIQKNEPFFSKKVYSEVENTSDWLVQLTKVTVNKNLMNNEQLKIEIEKLEISLVQTTQSISSAIRERITIDTNFK